MLPNVKAKQVTQVSISFVSLSVHNRGSTDVCTVNKDAIIAVYWKFPALKEKFRYQAPVAHAYNPSYSGGRDQDDLGLKPAQANSLWDPISKNLSQKRAGGVAQDVDPEFKPQYHQKKNKV
jgi:hypothetical protein